MSTATYPASVPSYGTIADEWQKGEKIARDVESIATQMGTVKATAACALTLAGGVNTIKVSSGCVRTIAAVGIATGATITISATGATHGQDFYISKTATGGTGAVVIRSHSFTTHKMFGCHLKFIGAAWRIISSWEQA